jgi:hypothetical protein
VDFTDMTPEQIQALIDDAQAALDARAEVEAAARAVRDAIDVYAATTGVTALQAWRELAPAEVEVPDDPVPAPAPDAPAWVQPTGAHDAYGIGDRVTYRGRVYESVIEGNSWSPMAYPQGWRKL